MGNPPFEDVSPIKNGGFPLLCWFTGGYSALFEVWIGNRMTIVNLDTFLLVCGFYGFYHAKTP